MLYTVKYKPLGSFFWKTIKNVKGDLTMMEDQRLPVRVFILDDNTRIEIPLLSCVFSFSKERHLSILKKMEEEAGQKINAQ